MTSNFTLQVETIQMSIHNVGQPGSGVLFGNEKEQTTDTMP